MDTAIDQQSLFASSANTGTTGREPRGRARRISILLTIIALCLWSYSITQAEFEIGKYGLIHGFPIIFFVALGILTIASAILWVSPSNHSKLLSTQLVFLVASLWLAPLLVGGAQSLYAVAYGDLGYAEYIVREGEIFASDIWQHNWPGNYIFQAIALQFSDQSTEDFADFLPWLPIIWQVLLFFPVFLFFKNTMGTERPNHLWAAMWLFYVANWVGVQNNGAQPFGVFMVFSLLAILTSWSVLKNGVLKFGYRLISVMILGTLAIVHLLASLVGLSVSAALYASKILPSPRLALVAAVLIVAWSMYGSMTYFEYKLPEFFGQGLRIDEAAQTGVTSPLSGNESHAAVSAVRIVTSGIFLALSVLGGLLAWKRKTISPTDTRVIIAIAIGCAFAAIVVGSGYRHELFERFYLFLLPCMAYFGAKLLHARLTTVAFTTLLIIALPLSFISQHGNQEMDYLSDGYLEGVHFFHDNTTHGWVDGDRPIGWMEGMERYWASSSYEGLTWESNELVMKDRRWVYGAYDYTPDYICISNHDRAFQTYFNNLPDLVDEVEDKLDITTDTNRVFANPDFSLYIHESESKT